ncbi:E3 ubiquitin-protein ligase RNF170-like [Rhopilema esculentum]|uniref:E3 ubiquitin-protein ligase RNF170-like n=1 Tax=Rhopilema esculentum TaxID=499914 RepID=UPI0031D01343|eukprot:gene12230-2863_t
MEAQFLEGFSNEALLFLIALILLPTMATYFWTRAGNTDHMVHPEQRATVLEAREHRAASERSQHHVNNGDSETQQQRRQIPNDVRFEQCPICLDQIAIPTETNCGHLFCAACIVAYWEAGSWLRGMNCPICRQEVSLLLTTNLHEEPLSESAQQSLSRIRAYNLRFSGEPRTLFQYIQDFPVLFRHLMWELFSVDGLMTMFRIRILLYMSLTVIYIISPLDLIPEAITGVLGFVDDIIILLVVLVYATVLYRYHVTGE